MPPSHLCVLVVVATGCLLAPAGRVHAQGIPFPTPASTNLSTHWTISQSMDIHGAQSFQYMDGTSVSVLLLQSIKMPPQEGLCFAPCFYCNAPCIAFLFGVCIVYVDSGGFLSWPNGPPPQVIWSANRGRLVRENATLSFMASGDLQLWDVDGRLIWSTNTSELSVVGMTVTRSGNLVLFDSKNVPVWQSFDHPTDSLLPGQLLLEGMRLTPNASATNWTISNQLYITVLADGLYGFAESSPPQLYFQTTVIPARNRKTYMILTNGSLVISASSSYTVAKINMSSVQTDMTYIRLESDGHPTVCGEYGICMSGQCTCPMGGNTTYFKQIDDRRINLGCSPVTPISCTSMPEHQLLALNNISYFNYIDNKAAFPQLIDEESCKKACLSNCSLRCRSHNHLQVLLHQLDNRR